jgi:hypothetical protein
MDLTFAPTWSLRRLEQIQQCTRRYDSHMLNLLQKQHVGGITRDQGIRTARHGGRQNEIIIRVWRCLDMVQLGQHNRQSPGGVHELSRYMSGHSSTNPGVPGDTTELLELPFADQREAALQPQLEQPRWRMVRTGETRHDDVRVQTDPQCDPRARCLARSRLMMSVRSASKLASVVVAFCAQFASSVACKVWRCMTSSSSASKAFSRDRRLLRRYDSSSFAVLSFRVTLSMGSWYAVG